MDSTFPAMRARDYSMAALCGLALAAALPAAGPALDWLAWLALVPFLALALAPRPRRAAIAVFGVFGAAFNLMALRWLLAVHPLTWLGFSWWQSLAIVTGLWLGCSALATAQVTALGALYAQTVRRWPQPDWRHAAVLALGWCALEWAESTSLAGYTGLDLVLTQWHVRPFLQALDLVGPFPLAGAMIFVAASLAIAWMRRERLGAACRALLPGAALLGLILTYGAWRMSLPAPGTAFSVGIVQGKLLGTERWNPNAAAVRRMSADYRRESATLAPTELLLWPETALPAYLDRTPALAAPLEALARSRRGALLTGGFEADARSDVYNAVYAYSADGRALGTYRKRQLVPFAEYLPQRALFAGLLRPLGAGLGLLDVLPRDITAGSAPGLYQLPFGTLGVGICFDAMAPELMRETVLDGANVLAICANDAWCRGSYGQYVLAAAPMMRAIEEHRWTLVAANAGVSGVIDPTGRWVARTPVQCEATLRARAIALSDLTVYARLGNGLAQLLAMLFLALWGLSLRGDALRRINTPRIRE